MSSYVLEIICPQKTTIKHASSWSWEELDTICRGGHLLVWEHGHFASFLGNPDAILLDAPEALVQPLVIEMLAIWHREDPEVFHTFHGECVAVRVGRKVLEKVVIELCCQIPKQ